MCTRLVFRGNSSQTQYDFLICVRFAQACNGDSCDPCLPQISFKKVKI